MDIVAVGEVIAVTKGVNDALILTARLFLAALFQLPVAFAVAVGAFARLSAFLMVFYTLGTALIGHRYWRLAGVARVDSMDGFFKNISIMGGFVLLYVTGAGRYSIDALYGVAGP